MTGDEEPWVCPCRQCCGVFSGADAVQYVWEFSFGACAVPVVVGVNTDLDGFVSCPFIYWHDEPAFPYAIGKLGEFMVSCRPGAGTGPTEGDIARWVGWESAPRPPRDWLIVDGKCFRSVPATVDALRRRAPMPDEQVIGGDWLSPTSNRPFRAEIHNGWAETMRRNRATSRL